MMIYRYLRAFVIALRMTLRGESLPPGPDAPLREWMAQGIARLDLIDQLAAQQQIDPQQVVLRIDRRDISMSTILRTVRFHLTEEYPIMLRAVSEYALAAVYSNNLDDHYRVTRLEEAAALHATPLQKAVAALSAHLEAIPRESEE
ncbi:MAG: hypothetical protein K8J31_27645 [Anaerolineae bacterium]|nr:hypothetical protein [Anaerolineae bacterium]